MKRGVALLVKLINRSPSTRVSMPFWRSWAVRRALTGAPVLYPMAITTEPLPGTLKRGLMRGSNITPKKWTRPRPQKSWDITRKGKRTSRTISHHVSKPLRAAWKTGWGKAIKVKPRGKEQKG